MPSNITLTVAGHTHNDWLRYSIDSDFFAPADAWQASLGITTASLPGWLVPWAEVQVRHDDTLIMTGRIDGIRRTIRKDGFELELTGRDLAAVLLDCSAPLYVRRQATLPELCRLCAAPLGVTMHDITPGELPYRRITVEPGMSAWDAIQQAAEGSGLWPWFTPDGILRIAAPDYTRPVDAELRLCAGTDAARNNVLTLAVEEDISRRYSEITVLGQSCGDELEEARTTIRASARDSGAAYKRPCIVDAGSCDTVAEARKLARKRLADGIFESLRISATVAGHVTSAGALWEPGMRVHVYAPPLAVERDMMLTRRTFRGGREGTFTDLQLKPWGVWLPDTSKGGRAGKDEEEELDLGIDWFQATVAPSAD